MKMKLRKYFSGDEIQSFNYFKIFAYYKILQAIELENQIKMIENLLITQAKPEKIESYLTMKQREIDIIESHYKNYLENNYNEYLKNVNDEYENFKKRIMNLN